jgi:hypothetical protein
MDRIRMTCLEDAETICRSVEVVIPARTRPLRTAALALGASMSLVVSGMVLQGSGAGEGDSFAGAALVSLLSTLAIPLAAAGILTWQLLWNLLGRETLLIDRKGIAVHQSVGPLRLSHRYSVSEKTSETGCGPMQTRADKPFWERLCIENARGCVVFCHEGRLVRIARDLDKAEGVYLITAIRVLMQAH